MRTSPCCPERRSSPQGQNDTKRCIWPRQKGHTGAVRPRAHSWYAQRAHSAWPHTATATSSPASMQIGHACALQRGELTPHCTPQGSQSMACDPDPSWAHLALSTGSG